MRLGGYKAWPQLGPGEMPLPLLREFPLAVLSLDGCDWLRSSCLAHLRGSPIADLTLDHCHGLSVSGLEHLAGLLLRRLSLDSCTWMTDSGLRVRIRELAPSLAGRSVICLHVDL